MIKITDKQIIEASKLPSATQAAASLGIHYVTYRVHAKRLNVWKTNPAGKGIPKDRSCVAIPLEKILSGNHPHYQTYKLKNRLLKEKMIEYKCASCSLTDWQNKTINLELDHIDGNKYNHKVENLRLLCPNCHSQTNTFRGRNK
jgi:5-methylcytosine-specific restriction endonuclease McrA